MPHAGGDGALQEKLHPAGVKEQQPNEAAKGKYHAVHGLGNIVNTLGKGGNHRAYDQPDVGGGALVAGERRAV